MERVDGELVFCGAVPGRVEHGGGDRDGRDDDAGGGGCGCDVCVERGDGGKLEGSGTRVLGKGRVDGVSQTLGELYGSTEREGPGFRRGPVLVVDDESDGGVEVEVVDGGGVCERVCYGEARGTCGSEVCVWGVRHVPYDGEGALRGALVDVVCTEDLSYDDVWEGESGEGGVEDDGGGREDGRRGERKRACARAFDHLSVLGNKEGHDTDREDSAHVVRPNHIPRVVRLGRHYQPCPQPRVVRSHPRQRREDNRLDPQRLPLCDRRNGLSCRRIHNLHVFHACVHWAGWGGMGGVGGWGDESGGSDG